MEQFKTATTAPGCVTVSGNGFCVSIVGNKAQEFADGYNKAMSEFVRIHADRLRVEKVCDDINAIMWESFMIKGSPFGRDEGAKIMERLEVWADDGKASEAEGKGGG